MNESHLIGNETAIGEHIALALGPQQALQLCWLVPLTIIYVLILVSGILGNSATILIICRFRYMQTITNLYLCNLAITDLISLTFSLPLELYSLWHQYPWQLGVLMCQMKAFVLESTANASVLTLVAFTVERYLAICATKSIPPAQSMFNTKSLSRTKRIACRNIAFIWAISLCGAAPLLPLTRVNYLELDSQRLVDSAWCGLAFNEPDKRAELVVFLSTFVFFIIPLVLISCLYFKIARKLKKATRLDSYSDMQLTDHATSRKIIQSRKIVIRMLEPTFWPDDACLFGLFGALGELPLTVLSFVLVITLVFTFCWSFYHAQRLFFIYVTFYSNWTDIMRQINSILFLSAGCLYYLNSSLNPLIYSLLSSRFRAAFMLYVNGCCGPWLSATSQQNNSNGQRSVRNGPGKSNSNNSAALVISGTVGGGQLKNTCLINEPGIVTKVQWNSKSQQQCLHNNHVTSNQQLQPIQNSW